MTKELEAQHEFDRAEGIFRNCKSKRAHNHATMLYLRGSDLLPHVEHPLAYLRLVIRQTELLVTYVIPNLLRDETHDKALAA